MNTFTFTIQGSLKPTAIRHHVFELGKFLGIHGFLNYRKGMIELIIHAEGEEETMVEFTNHVNQLVEKHNLICLTESATFKNCQNFQILPIWDEANSKSIHSNDNSNAVPTHNNSTEALNPDLQPWPTETKKHIPKIVKLISSFKQVGLW